MSKQQPLESERILALKHASVKENPPPERNYKQHCARLCVRFASLCTTAHLHHPTIFQKFADGRAWNSPNGDASSP